MKTQASASVMPEGGLLPSWLLQHLRADVHHSSDGLMPDNEGQIFMPLRQPNADYALAVPKQREDPVGH